MVWRWEYTGNRSVHGQRGGVPIAPFDLGVVNIWLAMERVAGLRAAESAIRATRASDIKRAGREAGISMRCGERGRKGQAVL